MRFLYTCIFLFVSCSVFAQDSTAARKHYHRQPLYLLDGNITDSSMLKKLNPAEVVDITVLKGAAATALYGSKAADGVVLIASRKFAKQQYWTFLGKKSDAYKKAVPDPASDSLVVYVINGKTSAAGNYEGELYKINEQNFIDLKVINKKALQKDYNLTGKKYGIVITKRNTPGDVN